MKKENSDNYTEDKRHVSLSIGRFWALELLKKAQRPLIFRLATHEIHHQKRNRITIQYANFEFSTLKILGGLGF